MGDPCVSYMKQVGRGLCCSREEKTRLLSGLRTEIGEAFPAGKTPTAEEISARFGAPSDMAAELQSALSEEEVARCRKRRRTRLCAGLAACAMVIILLVGYLVHLANVDIQVSPVKENIVYEDQIITED